jgi:hypothetical protein
LPVNIVEPRSAHARGAVFALGALRGRRWQTLPAEVERALVDLAAGADLPQGERLSLEVRRIGSVTVKVFPPRTVFGLLRTPRALRSARLHFQCLPVPSPRPLAALYRTRLGESVLVREFLPGRLLAETFGRDAASDAALPGFLAELRRLPWQHGDLHPRNLIWDGKRWLLLDVDGLRHGLHLRGRVLVGQWACLLRNLRDLERVRALFNATQALVPALDRTRWTDVLAAAGPAPSPGDAS